MNSLLALSRIKKVVTRLTSTRRETGGAASWISFSGFCNRCIMIVILHVCFFKKLYVPCCGEMK